MSKCIELHYSTELCFTTVYQKNGERASLVLNIHNKTHLLTLLKPTNYFLKILHVNSWSFKGVVWADILNFTQNRITFFPLSVFVLSYANLLLTVDSYLPCTHMYCTSHLTRDSECISPNVKIHLEAWNPFETIKSHSDRRNLFNFSIY